MTAASIREATVADAAEIVRLGELMYRAVELEPDEAWRANALRQVSTLLASDDMWGWVIDADAPPGAVVAFGGPLAASALVVRSPRLASPGLSADWRAYVQWVSTDPAYRRRGYARALMVRVLEFADAQGVDVVELHSSPFARAMYLSLGFAESPGVHYPPDVRGVPMQRRAQRIGDGGHA